jgi:hypothetical protein
MNIQSDRSHRGIFLKGFLTGFLTFIIAFCLLVFLMWTNRYRLAERVFSSVATEMMEKTFESFPDGYVTKNREKVMMVLDEFTNAVAEKEVSAEEFRQITQAVVDGLRDGKLKYQELDRVLALMLKATFD